MSYLRQPIVSVLGHVDHGKTSLLDFIRKSKLISKEAGGITQHIGATEVPKEDIIRVVKGFLPKDTIKVPGLLFIDTPGHKAFTSLRKRGGSISDIGILVVDVNEGFKPQTIEAVEILKSLKTPFIVAANKIDNIAGWQSEENKKFSEILLHQREGVIYKFEEKVYELVEKLNTFGYEADRYDRVDDFTKKIAVVPISAKTGEGISELIATLIGLTQKFMSKKLTIENETLSRGVVLEVKDYPGLGKTCDVILYDGVMKTDDEVYLLGIDGVKESRLKSILKPSELKEIRDSSTKFQTIKEVHAAAGVKLACPDFEEITAGMPLVTLRKNASESQIQEVKKELESESSEIISLHSEEGVLVKADTLGSLEALAHILEEHNILVRKARIGKVNKMDVIDTSTDLKKNERNALILNFSQKIDDEILNMSKKYDVTIISNDIIYKLVEEAQIWLENKDKEIRRKRIENLILPCKIKILPNCIFRTSGPAIVGVEVLAGTVKIGKQFMVDIGRRVGGIKSIKENTDFLQELKVGNSAALSIDNLIVGRHAQEDSILYSFMGEENFRKLKKNTDLLTKQEIETLKEIAEIMRKEDTLWGL